MVVIKQYTNEQINNLSSITGRILYDSTLNALRYNDASTYGNILICKDENNDLFDLHNVRTTGNVGINTTNPDAQLEVNSSTGSCLRLTYNDGDGSATNYADFDVSSSGNLTVSPTGDFVLTPTGNITLTPTGGDVDITSHNTSTTGLKLAGELVTSNATELNYLDGTTPGVATADRAMVFDSTRSIVNINYIETADFVSIKQNSADNTVDYPVSLITIPSTSAAVGLGTGIEFNSVNDNSDIYNAGYFNLVSSDITNGSESCFFDFRLANAGSIDSIMTVSSNGVVSCTSIVETSDIRTKENIENTLIDDSYSKILQVNVKTYNYIKDTEKIRHSGVIAQELKEIFPSAVVVSKNDDFEDFHQVKYTEMIPHLINCIKKLSDELNTLKENKCNCSHVE